MARPLGEKLGSSLLPSFWVMRVIFLVSRSSVTMSKLPPSRVVYASTRVPFLGDHVGVVLYVPLVDTRRAAPPDAGTTKICGPPSRSDTNAISRPSGDHAGPVSM